MREAICFPAPGCSTCDGERIRRRAFARADWRSGWWGAEPRLGSRRFRARCSESPSQDQTHTSKNNGGGKVISASMFPEKRTSALGFGFRFFHAFFFCLGLPPFFLGLGLGLGRRFTSLAVGGHLLGGLHQLQVRHLRAIPQPVP